ncbi:anti-sigma K factor RskA [Nitratireductor indicus C115]|uniref:Anti-sigma K factor RskA n=1 Tax=Nitratireductor indicus C115 TaxID=1231190 RepID=K2PJ56_9HYPH|nr:anti-sigma factor [Nitratireductor indicus]EKF41172.1 anti-sigma K factor RskA [Nitratireductor indicus C115]SFQ64443.1 Anti-sigma-K factor RskA [Nitratireductor indicus]
MTVEEQNGRDDDLVAAEYVLGVLPAEERAQVSRRIDDDRAFARLVEEWEARLAPMAEGFAPVPPPETVKAALDERLFETAHAARKPGLWESLAFWRGAAVAALLGLVIVGGLALNGSGWRPGEQDSRLRFVASLTHDDSDVRYLAVYDDATRDVALSHVSGERPQGRDFELWAIEGDEPPISLGVIPSGASVHISLSGALGEALRRGAVFAITAEPLGGSPSGAPTGPVVAAGDLRDI